MTVCWWLIQHSPGHDFPYLTLTGDRLGSSAVSDLTPGPQFDSRQIQVFALQHYHGIPGTTSSASVRLDKLCEYNLHTPGG